MRAIREPGTALLLLSLFLAACGGGADRSGSSSPTWTLTGPEVRIGSVDDPDYAFGQVLRLALGPDGTLYSVHVSEGAVRKWSPDGHPAGTLGRKGEGPGEFSQPTSLGFWGDTLWVMDGMGMRLTEFASDGTLLGTVNPNLTPGKADLNRGFPRPMRPLRDGHWYGTIVRAASLAGESRPRAHLVMESDGTVLDTVWVEATEPRDNMTAGSGGMVIAMPQPFSDQPKSVVLDDGSLVVVDFRVPDEPQGATYSATKLAASGDTLWHTVLPYTPTPLPRESPDSAFDAMTARFPPALQDMKKGLRDKLHFPPYVPVVKDVQVAEDGSVWIHQAEAVDGGDVWQILDRGGEPVARAVVPTGLRILLVHGDEVWGVERDDLDVNYIVRYRVNREVS